MSAAKSPNWLLQRVRLAVGQRLLLGLAPALLAVVLVVALAYYGEFGREAPEYVVTGAGLLAIVSLVLTWWNTRYLSQRLHRLGRNDDGGRGGDESAPDVDDLDRIEGEVTRLTTALEQARGANERERLRLEQQLHTQGTMLAASVRGMSAQVDEIRLPLHILLDARFGDLNENQEELLASARAAAEQIDADLRRLGLIADADRDALVLRREPVALNDLLRAVLPMVRASAERRGANVELALEPALPRVWANRSATAEALALITTRAVESLAAAETLMVDTTSGAGECVIRIQPWRVHDALDPVMVLAERMLHRQDAALHVHDQTLRIALPRVSPASTSAQASTVPRG